MEYKAWNICIESPKELDKKVLLYKLSKNCLGVRKEQYKNKQQNLELLVPVSTVHSYWQIVDEMAEYVQKQVMRDFW